MVPYYLQDASAPLPFAFHQVGWPFIGWVVSIGALFGLSTSLLGAMFPLPRVLYAMSSDGLIFRWLSVVHPKYQVKLEKTYGHCVNLLLKQMLNIYYLSALSRLYNRSQKLAECINDDQHTYIVLLSFSVYRHL